MRQLVKSSSILLIFAGFLWAGCATTNTTSEAKYIGDWEYLVKDTPNGDVEGVMSISKDGDKYTAVLKSEMGDNPLNDLVIENDKLTANFEIQGMVLEVNGNFEGASFNGAISLDYNEFPLTMKKK